jgi:5,10-methylenetetrahydrofolate reductase
MRLTEKISANRPVIVVEFKPDDSNLQSFVGMVKPYVDAIRLTALKNSGDPTNPSRTPEQMCLEAATKLTLTGEVDVITSILCRDHPREDMDILTRLKNSSVDNLLVLYGDPNDPPYPNHYEFQSTIDLIRWIKERESRPPLNTSRFCIAVGTNSGSENRGREISSLVEKKRAGADLAITQPVFDINQIRGFLQDLKARNGEGKTLPVLVSLLALKSEKSIAFIEKRIGVRIPASVKDRMKGKGAEEGLRVAQEVHESLLNEVEGFYVCPWADPDLKMTVSLLRELRNL